MTDSAGSQPPGWYQAQGDPPGTQRYWDGSQWVGGPQAAQDSAVEAGGYGQQPSYAGSTGTGAPAAYGTRAVALIIDALVGFGIVIAGLIVGFLLGFVSDTLGAIMWMIAVIGGMLVFPIWNAVFKQGQTGQTIGKTKQNIKLVSDTTGGPIGVGPAFIRYLLAGLLTSICYLDVLWPLFDEQKKRLTDKILNLSVVDA